MKINSNKLLLTRKSCLLVCFFTCMFVFASFTREDRQRVRELKKDLISKLTDKKVDSLKQDSKKESSDKSIAENTLAFSQNSVIKPTLPLDFNSEKKVDQSFNFNDKISANSSSYASKEKEGTIGTFSDKEEDQISDNFFTIDIPVVNKENTTAYLEYDLFGLASHESVPRSINHNIAIGGGIVVPSAQWSHQREAISGNLIKTGSNSILFTSPSAGVKYKIKNLKLVFETDKKSDNNLNVSSVLSGDQLYVKGNNLLSTDVNINNEHVALKKGEFEKIIQLSDKDKASGLFSIVNGGISNTFKIPNSTKSFKIVNNQYFNTKGIEVLKDQELSIDYEGINVKIEKETSESAYLEVLKLRAKDFPAISQGVKNVTAENSAYRLSIRSGKLNKKVKITIPYDDKRLGLVSPKDIKIFIFDYTRKQWTVDKSSVVDTKNKTVTVEGNGDGDYINGIISVPESPQTTASAPTSISGLKAGDPTANLPFIAPPGASQKGDANVSYPILIPSGRNGMQPNLAISYSSGKGNGWMGEGWDISGLSSIEVDTRWGSPQFDASGESELYSLDGQTLVYQDDYMPNRHTVTSGAISTVMQSRNTAGVKTFYLRSNHDFSKIERYGNSPANYRWVITSPNGNKTYYGGDENSLDDQSVLKSLTGNSIVKWGIYKVEDPYKNNIKFYYDNLPLPMQSGENENLSAGRMFNINTITYTGKDGDDGYYSVIFEKEDNILRKDLSINAKLGVKYIEPYRLKKIKIINKQGVLGGQFFRSYKFYYKEGEFNKSLLEKVALTASDDEYHTYVFDYHNDLKDGNTVLPMYGPDTTVSTFQDDSSLFSLPSGHNPAKINTTYTKSEGASLRIGLLMDFLKPTQSGYGNIILFSKINSTTGSKAKGAHQFIDFNGDGIPDILTKKSDGLFLRPGVLSGIGILSGFGSEIQIKNLNSNFAYTETKEKARGKDWGGGVSFLSWSIYANTSNIKSSSKSITPTYLVDANSDGVMDVVDGKDVWFNSSQNGTPTFTKYSENTENMVIKANDVSPEPVELLPKDDVIKFWIAPKDGYIRISDKISIENVNGANAVYSIEVPFYINSNSTYSRYYRVYLNRLVAGISEQNINISRYNDYFSAIKNMLPLNNQHNHLGVENPDRIFVKSGDKVYIRLHQNEGDNYKVNSDPNIVYIDPDTGNEFIYYPWDEEDVEDGFYPNNGSYSSNFLLNNHEDGLKLTQSGNITINVPAISFFPINDDIKVSFVLQNLVTSQLQVLNTQNYSQSIGGTTNPFSINASISDPSVLMCLVESISHKNYKFTGLNDITVNYTTGGSSYNLNLVPRYNSYYVTNFKPKVSLIDGFTRFPQGQIPMGIQINKNISSSINVLNDFSFIYVVKNRGRVLGKRKVIGAKINGIFTLTEQDYSTNQTINGVEPIPFFHDFWEIFLPDYISIQLYFETYIDRQGYEKLKNDMNGLPFNVYMYQNHYLSVAETSYNSASFNPISKIYKNWGQFLYRNEYTEKVPGVVECILNGTCDNYGILVGGAISEPYMNINTTACNGLTNADEMQACLAQNSQMYMPENVFPLTTLKLGNVEKWKGIAAEQYSSATAFKDDEYSLGLFNPIGLDANPTNIDDVTAITPNSGMTTMKAADKIFFSSSQTKAYSGTASAFVGVGVNLGYTESQLDSPPGSILIQDFTDLNGDGYPDFISKDKIQLTYATGGHKGSETSFVNDEVTRSNNYQKAITASANFNAKAFKTTGSNAKNGQTGSTAQGDNSAPWSPDVGVSASFNFDSKDTGESYWMDINGDGLLDRITGGNTNGLNCSFNYGKGLLGGNTFYNSKTYSSYPIGSAGISFGGSLTALINVLAGISSGFGINVSAGNSKSTGTSEKTFEDVNGDGLVDILTLNSGVLSVNYNLGNKFTSQTFDLKKDAGSPQNINFSEELENFSGYGSIGAAVYIPIGPIPILPFPTLFLFNIYIKAGVDISGNIGMTMSEVKKSFKDVNGDGFNDLVRYEGDNLIINYSRIGKTNKLKQVTNEESNATFTIDYTFTTPGYDDPNARLVMSEVKVLNPDVFSPTYTTSNAAKDIKSKFIYELGKYDRRERQFLGFGKVTSNQYADTNVYRKNIDTYYNRSFHTAGLLRTSESYTAGATLLSKVENNYTLYKFNTNNTQLVTIPETNFETYDAGGKEGRLKAVALVNTTTNTIFETGNSIQTSKKMFYNGTGQLINYQYVSPSLSYNSMISYHVGLPNNILNVPQSIDVYEGITQGGNALRHRETKVNDEGDVTQVKVDLNSSEFAITDITYDPYGNISKIQYPENEQHQRYQLDYDYDPEFYKYAVKIKNSFDEYSYADYDTNFDVPTLITDTSGNITKFDYDGRGRIIRVLGPKEELLPPTSNLGKYTIRYNYGLSGVPNNSGSTVNIYSANTLHYNTDNPSNPIETITFSDGFGKVVQTKKDFDYNGTEYMLVSGAVDYDVFGRAILQRHPSREFKGSMSNLLGFNMMPYSTKMQYDIKDRIIKVDDEYNVSTLTSYIIENNQYKTTVTIPSANQKAETFNNAEGKVVQQNNYELVQPYVTNFEYSTTGELIKVTDPENLETSYGYDNAGRREWELHPDHGMSKYKYDTAGNLISSTSANLDNDPNINVHNIQYKYFYNRLTDVILPALPNGQNPNDVHYKYAGPGSGNDTGKLIYKRDGTGESFYSYGNLGELIKEKRDVYGYGIPNFSFTTQFSYDSWGRIRQINYPDGEEVYYKYNLGGNLKSVTNGNYEYIKSIVYNDYDERRTIAYGNGTSNFYEYDLKRRLAHATLGSTSSGTMLNNTYEYDTVGNIKKIKNDAQPLANGMGGMYVFNYNYDRLNRLSGTQTEQVLVDIKGNPIPSTMNIPSSHNLVLEYNESSGIIYKGQYHEVDQQVNPLNTYNNKYSYIKGTHMLEKVSDGLTGNSEIFKYDFNGNVTANDSNTNGISKYYWDEQDHMKAYFNDQNGVYQYYAYDDKGERVLKYNLYASAQLYQNGILVDPGSLSINEFKVYPNPYVVVSSNGQYTKNYFEGTNRFASRVIDGIDIFKQSTTKAQSPNTNNPKPDVESDFKTYLKKAGVESEISSELSSLSLSNAQPGLYYLHGDHLGTASFVTDQYSESTQYFLNLPFGETMFEQQSGVYDNPYKFNAKELDAETGLYYYGARYYNPRLSVWYGVDPLAGKMPSWSPYVYTFNNPIRFIDPDGRMPVPPDIITKVLSAKTTTYPSGTKLLSREVSMTMTLIIYNPENLNLSTMGLKSQGILDWKEFRGSASRSINSTMTQDDNIKNLAIVYKVVNNIDDIKGTANVMTITAQTISDNGKKVNGLTDGYGGQFSIIDYQNGNFKHTFFHELGHQLGLDGEGYQRPGFSYPNEDSNTIIDSNGLYNVTTMQKAKAGWTIPAAKKGDVFKKSENSFFNTGSKLKTEMKKFNEKSTR